MGSEERSVIELRKLSTVLYVFSTCYSNTPLPMYSSSEVSLLLDRISTSKLSLAVDFAMLTSSPTKIYNRSCSYKTVDRAPAHPFLQGHPMEILRLETSRLESSRLEARRLVGWTFSRVRTLAKETRAFPAGTLYNRYAWKRSTNIANCRLTFAANCVLCHHLAVCCS